MRVVQCLAHAIESYDMLQMYHSIGVDALDLGPYIDPANPHVDIRPALPQLPFHPDLKAVVDRQNLVDNIGGAQAYIPDELLEWLGDDGAIVYHHYLDQRLVPQWPRLRDWKRGAPGRRIIWRSVGQSVEYTERLLAPLRSDGLERVAYSPKEANIPGYTHHDALIRFGKDPNEWTGWTGEDAVVLNFTQHDAVPHARDVWVNWQFWEEATRGLPTVFGGSNSEKIGGIGQVSYDVMRDWLRRARVYLYTGTQPASYTLGLIEAMMTGIPVVSIGPEYMRVFPYGPALFEGHELAGVWGPPEAIRGVLAGYLRDVSDDRDYAAGLSAHQRARAIDLFGKTKIAAEWAAFLGIRVPVAA